MLRIINNLKTLRISTEALCTNYSTLTYDPALLPVKRSHRKPRWLPTAKTKLFKVPKRPQIPEDESKEILRLYNNYRNNVKSIRKYLHNKHYALYQKSFDPEENLRIFKEDFQKCTEINDKWNAEVKINREKRFEQRLQEDIAFAKNRIDMELKKQEEKIHLAEEMVRKEKEASVSFITPENIDAAIDKALTETVDYNFAIDMNGEKIHGRETRPVKEKQKVAVQQ